jgi:hypothetical protein
VSVALLLVLLVSSLVFVDFVWGESLVDVLVDVNSIVGVNGLSLGFALDYEWQGWRDNAASRQLAQQAGFRLVRFFTHKGSSPRPCTYWNESTDTGVFDWSAVDLLVQRIFEIGAEPLICLGGCNSAGMSGLPRGMAKNSTTGLAYPASWAAYCAAWVKHFKTLGMPVRFYEIINEPQTYLLSSDWQTVKVTRLRNYIQLFNAAAKLMRLANSNLAISFDCIIQQQILNYWLANGGAEVDSLNFHKYDSWITTPYESDGQMFYTAETQHFGKWPYGNSPNEAQELYSNSRGRILPIINSESNMNAAWENGTDPRIQQMAGAVWLALVLRMDVLNGVNYNLYFSFSSSESYGKSTPTGGAGFGMVNADTGKPWYPYYVHQMIGNNLAAGDQILESTSSSSGIRTLAWIHGTKLNLMLICKTSQPQKIHLAGITGQADFLRIDNTISWKSPRVQTGTINTTNPIVLEGYTVMLVQQEASSPPSPVSFFEDGFEPGDFSAWTGTITTQDENVTVSDRAYSGSYAAKFTSSGYEGSEYAYCYKNVEPSSELFARGYFRVEQSGISHDDDRFYFIRFRAGPNNTAYAGWRQVNGTVIWRLTVRDGAGWATNFSTATTSLNQWYCVELHWIGDSTAGGAELWVDGEKTCSIQDKNTASLGKTARVLFGLAESYNCSATTIYCDNCEISKSYIGSSVVFPPWDLNEDGKVNVLDFSIFGVAYGSTPQSPNWNPKVDLNADGKANILDAIQILIHFDKQ